jgi:hypothetical protein
MASFVNKLKTSKKQLNKIQIWLDVEDAGRQNGNEVFHSEKKEGNKIIQVPRTRKGSLFVKGPTSILKWTTWELQ